MFSNIKKCDTRPLKQETFWRATRKTAVSNVSLTRTPTPTIPSRAALQAARQNWGKVKTWGRTVNDKCGEKEKQAGYIRW